MRTFFPYLEVFRYPVTGVSLKAIKEAGFDGVEFHLVGSLRRSERVKELRREASDLGLAIRFHQGWSWDTGQRNLLNMALRPLGALVPVGTSLAEQVRDAGEDPVVVYGNQIVDGCPHNHRFQTACEHRKGKEFMMPFSQFLGAVRHIRPFVVFDIQHALEWSLDATHVDRLPNDPAALVRWACELWQALGPLAEEIHLCDFNPGLGPSRGRNVFLGQGIFPLEEFCARVRASGWDGIVTPEVAPQHLKRGGGLGKVREIVERLFAR